TGKFLQFKKLKDTESEFKPLYVEKAGIYTVVFTMQGPMLVETDMIDDKILEDYIETDGIIQKVECFFKNIDAYIKHKISPKRGLLLYGVPGCGKTAAISKVCEQYKNRKDSVVLVWKTNQVEASKMSAV